MNLNLPMNELKLHFEKAGLFTSIQDKGRFGVQHLGIPIGGAMDKEAMEQANHLVGNDLDAPVIEITLNGPTIKVIGSGQIALTGGYFKGTWNDQPLPFYRTLDVNDGDLIKIEGAVFGARTYLAVNGQLLEEKWMGSFSAVNQYMTNFGLESHFADGRMVSFQTHTNIETRHIERAKHPIHSDCAIVRTISGPDFDQFPIELIQSFYEKVFTISRDCDRMGYRLNEQLEGFHPKKQEISSGTIPGTIQITNNGTPILLLADAQTTGGYPRIAHIVKEDIDVVAQLRPGNHIKFMLISLEDL